MLDMENDEPSAGELDRDSLISPSRSYMSAYEVSPVRLIKGGNYDDLAAPSSLKGPNSKGLLSK